MPDRDYTHRAVVDKLGLQPGMAVRVVGVRASTAGARELLADVAARTGRRPVTARTPADVVLYWPRTAAEIGPTLAALRGQIHPAGGIWVITAKRGWASASGLAYFNQDQLIPLGAAARLVDNKVCSLSERESAMRFVIRRDERPKTKAEGRP